MSWVTVPCHLTSHLPTPLPCWPCGLQGPAKVLLCHGLVAPPPTRLLSIHPTSGPLGTGMSLPALDAAQEHERPWAGGDPTSSCRASQDATGTLVPQYVLWPRGSQASASEPAPGGAQPSRQVPRLSCSFLCVSLAPGRVLCSGRSWRSWLKTPYLGLQKTQKALILLLASGRATRRSTPSHKEAAQGRGCPASCSTDRSHLSSSRGGSWLLGALAA